MSRLPSILMVDDEIRSVEMVKRILRRLADVETAMSGEEGWVLFQQRQFDLVITDQRMPGISGVELLGRVADHAAATGRILLTGYADSADTIEAINRGRVHAYLSKPCPADQLRATVHSVMERTAKSAPADVSGSTGAVDPPQLPRLLRSISELVRAPLVQALESLGEEPARESRSRAVSHLETLDEICARLAEAAPLLDVQASREPMDVDALIAAQVEAALLVASAQGVRIETEAAGGEIEADPRLLRVALAELVRNALEAMPDGGVLQLSAKRVDGELILRVRDSGPGLPAEAEGRVLEPLVSHGKPGATGLGLAIAAHVARVHGGALEQAKAEGEGALLELRLPCRSV
jgi:signal transduction histidine kinase